MNNVSIIGRLVIDPELRMTPNSVAVSKFDIAVNRRANREETDFFSCVAWKNNAEFITKYFRKGSQIAIQGHLATRTWKDKEGKNRKEVEIVIDSVDFVGSKNDGAKTEQKTYDPLKDTDVSDSDADDDLPF